MSNPLDRYLETLKGAEPRPEAVDRAVASLRRAHPPRLVPLTVGVAALSAALLWPRPGNGLAWAQIAAQDLPPRFYESRSVVAGGKTRLIGERWVDRPADATRRRDFLFKNWPESGKSVAANPIDREFDSIESPRGVYDRQNRFATFTRKLRPKSPYDPRLVANIRNRTGLERLLEAKGVRQLSVERDVETRVGRADRYVLDRPADSGDVGRTIVFVEPGTNRVLGSDEYASGGDVWQQTFRYPDRFAASTFAIPQPGVRVFDLDALNARVAARLKAPIATLRSGGQTSVLRLVAQDERNELWVLWSGARPNGDLKDHVRVLGMPNGARHGSMLLESKGFNGVFSRFGGHSVSLNRRVDRVDLEIPVFAPGAGRSRFAGDATVRGVAVLHLPFVAGLEEVDRSETGIRRPFVGTTPRPGP